MDALGLGAVSTETRTAWAAWVQHRKEIGHPLTAMAAARSANLHHKLGPTRFAAAIDWSIQQGYRGLFEPGGCNNPETPARPKAKPGKYQSGT